MVELGWLRLASTLQSESRGLHPAVEVPWFFVNRHFRGVIAGAKAEETFNGVPNLGKEAGFLHRFIWKGFRVQWVNHDRVTIFIQDRVSVLIQHRVRLGHRHLGHDLHLQLAIVGAQLVEIVRIADLQVDHGRAFLEGHEHRVNGEITTRVKRADQHRVIAHLAGFGCHHHIAQHNWFAGKVGDLDGQTAHLINVKHAFDWVVERNLKLREREYQQGDDLVVNYAVALGIRVDKRELERVGAWLGSYVDNKFLFRAQAAASRDITQ